VYDASGNPIETIFINWDKVTDIRINKGELLYYVQGFTNPLLASEVLHFKNFTLDGIVGVGAITLWRTAIGINNWVQNFSATNFENKGDSVLRCYFY
jgi:phage portal protein BeeE